MRHIINIMIFISLFLSLSAGAVTPPPPNNFLVGISAAPATPTTGYRLWLKTTDQKIYVINSSGISTEYVPTSVTTNANLTGVITSVGNATSIASQTGTGTKFVVDTSPTLVTPNLGTPTTLIGTNITGTGSGFTAGHVTTNANLTGPITSSGNTTSVASQTGTGSTFVMDTSPTLVTPNLGTPSTLVGTNISGTASGFTAGHVTTNANLTGPITSSGNSTSIASQTGTGTTFVMDTSPTLVTPNLGTPTTLVGTNITGTASGLTAGTVTTNANLTGDVTSTGNATTIGASKVTNSMLAGSIAAAKLIGSDIATVGTITSGTWNGTTIAANRGGSGFSSYTVGDTLIADTTSTLSKVAAGSQNTALVSQGSGAVSIPLPIDRNAILNWHAGVNTTGWTQYGVAGQNPPVDGSTTVGSVHITWARDTASPLINDSAGNFLLTKDAVNRQGEGNAYDFTIDRSYAVAPGIQYLKFDYEVASGTFAPGSTTSEGDQTIWIYDKTNNVLIQPFVYRLGGQKDHFVTWFQNNFGSSSYRLIIHTASTSASAYTVRFNRFKIEPALANNSLAPSTDIAAAMTGGQVPTGTLNSSFNVAKFGTITKDSNGSYDSSTGLYTAKTSGWYYASGSLEVTYASASVSAVVIAGIAVNGTVKTQMPAIVQATAVLRLVAPVYGLVYVNAGDTIGLYSQTNTTTPSYTANSTGSNFMVFKLGGGSSGNPGTAPIAARYHSATATVTNSFSNLTYTTADYDNYAMCSGATCTMKYPGKYLITASIIVTATGTHQTGLQLTVNGTGVREMYSGSGPAGIPSGISSDVILIDQQDLKAGDAVVIKVLDGGTSPSVSGVATRNVLTIVRIGDTDANASNTSVNASYISTATTSFVTNIAQTITYNGVFNDDQGLLNSATGIFTARNGGVYQACGNANLVGSVANALGDIFITIGGNTNNARQTGIAGGIMTPTLCFTARLTAGQTAFMQVRCTFGSGTCALNTALGGHYFSVTRVGN